ncbi:hypothetical protein FC756_16210 [Lysinibacillus mangiferihumi]|uniref:Uncharacterized protein n=1 Tax=Lysinibacillus mangiferihumi TaxID=1130819 RepID=A0A4U2YXP5_9BACI|nr:hypothetical protein [Lysinibacillus mangiferihumi]TKI65592.1 hypothetical protein FC756_16210 [Lysinibacillus mangiferihumi]
MKVFQQNIFGGEDVVLTSVPVIVLKHRGKEGRYLANDIECIDWSDPDGDVTMDDIESAFIIVRNDHTRPDLTDVENVRAESAAHKKYMIERFGEDASISFDVDKWLETYEPINIDIPADKFNKACILNGWEPVAII